MIDEESEEIKPGTWSINFPRRLNDLHDILIS
jgi:hypothetical protein